MAIVVVTTSPATLDSGSSEFVTVTNTGTVDVTVARGSQSFVLRPTQGRTVYPEGASVTASVASGSGQVTTTAQPAQVTQAQQLTANTAAIAGLPGTYARLRQAHGRNRFTPDALLGTPATMASAPTITTALATPQIASSVQYAPTNAALTVLGPTVADNGFGYLRPPLATGSTAWGSPWTITFDLFGSRFEIRYSTKGETGEFRIKVDGQYADPAGDSLPNVNDGADKYILVDFTTVATRRIEVEMTRGVGVRWIAVDPTAIVSPAPQNGPTGVIVGDSYSLGFGVIGNTPSSVRGYPGRLRDMLGWGRLVVDGFAGTGYSHTANKYSTRLASLAASLANPPDVVLVQASVNDNGDTATLQADATAYLTSVAAQWPSAVVLATTTPAFPVASGTANRAANDTRIAAAAAASGAQLVDISTPAVTGTGKAGATTGNGPADILMSGDGVHPSLQGHEFLARLVASRVLGLSSSPRL